MVKPVSKWNNESKLLIKELHDELSIKNKNWHLYKSDPERRAAELLISALAQLINQGDLVDVEELLNQAIKWLRKEIKDPGCPQHN
tara:strand:- start:1117 stop:1374 length:258 start_codon:yes stop_codon:yes gene_type:complete